MTTETTLETVDGYTIVDIEDSRRLVGPVRSAKKVLQRTTIDLIRHATYTCAVHGLDAVGAAAALNHDRSSGDTGPVVAFRDEVDAWAKTSSFTASAALGLGPEEAGGVLHPSAADHAATTAASAVACLPKSANLVVIASDDEEADLGAALEGAAVDVEADLGAALRSGADAVFVRGKTGVLDHATLEGTTVKLIIGLQPLTTTARGLAVASRAGAVIVPDFLSAGGPTLAALDLSTDRIAEMTRNVADELAASGTDQFVTACEHAEAHLRTMTDTLPFGRPLAP